MSVATARPARVGVIVPSSNVVVEPALAALVGWSDAVELFVSRLGVTEIVLSTGEDAPFSQEALWQAAALLVDADVDVIGWAGTSGSWLGPDHDRRFVELVESTAQRPATTSTLALLEACSLLGVERLGLVTPYTDDVVAQIIAQFAAEGLEVAGEAHLGLSENRSFAEVPAEQLLELARTAALGGADALAIVCTNLRGIPVIAPIEAELGLACLDSLAVTASSLLRLAGRPGRISGPGRWLASGDFLTELHEISARLLEAAGADRVTIRLDSSTHQLGVDLPAAEAARAGVARMARDSSMDQRALETIRWLELEREPLIQELFSLPPFPADGLTGPYGVRAQMLGPIERDGVLVGWVSVHALAERPWGDGDQAALAAAVDAVDAALRASEQAVG